MSRSRQSPERRHRAPTVLGYLGRRSCGAPAGRAAGAQPRSPQPVEEGGQRLRHGQGSAAGRRCSGLARTRQPSGLTAPCPFPAGSAPRPPLGVPPRAPRPRGRRPRRPPRTHHCHRRLVPRLHSASPQENSQPGCLRPAARHVTIGHPAHVTTPFPLLPPPTPAPPR